ncbi:MAG TPA: hypothetical protein GX745_00950 [Clostridiales bacterium]|nr:hypothetical protein [Clostridiales bacterium]
MYYHLYEVAIEDVILLGKLFNYYLLKKKKTDNDKIYILADNFDKERKVYFYVGKFWTLQEMRKHAYSLHKEWLLYLGR